MADVDTTKTGRRPSIVLLLAGLASVLVAISALFSVNPLGMFGDIRLGWLFVIAAIVIGVLLVLTPARALRRKK